MSETRRWDEPERDTRLGALYRAADQDEPSAALDAAVRAAARREVGARPRPAGWPFSRSWQVPLSIAAVILLSVTLVTVMRNEAPEIAQPPRADTPLPEMQSRKEMVAADRMGTNVPSAQSPAKQAAPEAFPGPADKSKSKVAALAEKPRRSAQEEMRRDAALFAEPQQRPEAAEPGHPAEAAASAAVPRATRAEAPPHVAGAAAEAKAQLRPEAARADSSVRESARERMQSAPAPMPQPVPQMADGILAYVNLPPEKWLEQIEELRRQGRLGEAKKSFAEFKQRYPDYRLPTSLKKGINP